MARIVNKRPVIGIATGLLFGGLGLLLLGLDRGSLGATSVAPVLVIAAGAFFLFVAVMALAAAAIALFWPSRRE